MEIQDTEVIEPTEPKEDTEEIESEGDVDSPAEDVEIEPIPV